VQVAAGPSNAIAAGDNNGNDYGDYMGLAYYKSKLFPIWVDNSKSLAGNPDLPNFDIATAEVDTPGGTGGGGGGGGGVVLPEDRFELNDTSDKATKLGTLSAAQQFAGLTIATHKTALPDYDWYTWTMSQDGVFHAKITYTPLSGGDLHMRVFRLD